MVVIPVLFMALAMMVLGEDSQGTKSMVTIVVHDRIRGFLNWLQPWFVEAARTPCSTKCLITEDKAKLKTADVVLFHAPTHQGMAGLTKPNEGPLYVFISMEQPRYARYLSNLAYLEKNFDLISTYSLKEKYPGTKVPNMPITYYPLNILSHEAVMQPAKPFAKKDGFGTGVTVAVFASNCRAAGALQRSQFVKELMDHIPVHSYGKCNKNREEPKYPVDARWPQIAQRRASKIKTLSNYKFYLAFENFQVDDYVSEKIFESLFAGAVPVYRGASLIHQFMPANDSFIDANNMQPQDLAQLLNKLGQSETEYNKYFAFKDRPISDSFKEITLMSYTHPNVLCRLCEYALDHKKKKV